MRRDIKGKEKKGIKQDVVFLGISLILVTVLLLVFPEKQKAVITVSWEFFTEIILILPAVMILMGLFAVWVPDGMIMSYLGKASGHKGALLSFLLGALPTGPVYLAFPVASALIKKGARISNAVIFLSSWACIKIPQEMIELQFLGVKFMALRLTLTIVFVAIMGLSIERIIGWSNKRPSSL